MKKILLILSFAALAVTAGCKKQSANEIIIGASPTPHAEILYFAQPYFEKAGIKVKVLEMSDYIIPNTALDSNDIQANYMQHEPYLIDFNKKNKLKNHLVSAGKIHFEPLGIYAGKSSNIEDIKNGAIIGIPNDPTNGARALLLLDDLGILKINKNKGFEATELDIIDNPKNIIIKAMEAAQLPVSLPDLDFAVINGNYALGAGVLDKVIVGESNSSHSASTFGNIVAVREQDLNNPQIQKIIEILKSEPVKQYIQDTYNGVVITLN